VAAWRRFTTDPRPGGEALDLATGIDPDGRRATWAVVRDLARWLGIYEELVSVTEALLEGASDRATALSSVARQHLLETEVRPIEARHVSAAGRGRAAPAAAVAAAGRRPPSPGQSARPRV
jgi:hypothetical protein